MPIGGGIAAAFARGDAVLENLAVVVLDPLCHFNCAIAEPPKLGALLHHQEMEIVGVAETMQLPVGLAFFWLAR